MRLIHMSVGGPDFEILDEAGERWRFEMHPQCGPAAVGRHGELLKRQPGPRHSFWWVVTLWAQQGKRVASGLCVWEKPAEPERVHMGGHHWKLVFPQK